jgi:hypothetical protein
MPPARRACLLHAGPGRSRRPPDYRHAQLPTLDFSELALPDSKLHEAAQWVAACHAAAVAPASSDGGAAAGAAALLRVLRGQLPPPLEDDERLGLLDAAVERLAAGLRWLRSSSGLMAGSGLGESTVQMVSTAVILGVLGLLHLVWFQ